MAYFVEGVVPETVGRLHDYDEKACWGREQMMMKFVGVVVGVMMSVVGEEAGEIRDGCRPRKEDRVSHEER